MDIGQDETASNRNEQICKNHTLVTYLVQVRIVGGKILGATVIMLTADHFFVYQ